MATKTISLDLDAYEELKRAKLDPRESFSSVVRRAVWPEESHSAERLLAFMRKRSERGLGLPDESVLDFLDKAQDEVRRSESKC